MINDKNIEMQFIGDSGYSGIEVRGNIALVTQNHWLQNMSVRDNITFGCPYIYEWYQECIMAC